MERIMKLLHVESSILGQASASRALTAEIIGQLHRQDPTLEVTHRDLGSEPLLHLSTAHLAAAQGNLPDDPAIRHDVESGAQALEEFLAADIIVVGAPMYNFGVPSQLKAWIDRIAVAGKTFRYTPNGPEGLAKGKRVIIASSRGGFYGPDSPANSLDHQESYLRGVFGFLGITDITVVRAEGLNVGPEVRTKSLDAAKAHIASLGMASEVRSAA
jgi:FMN-dependent NADH-azoreductase